ncbi:dual specificity protein phosphatase 18-like [Oppia nitens]|uniref:dual specificity protein phosphatase 18-like n=1 Tax=Oppia nitens TaxID=1686743 RepID=UPI0023DB5E61|nr:dual specificity protein phosphatase 18-like [Oppia nitens]
MSSIIRLWFWCCGKKTDNDNDGGGGEGLLDRAVRITRTASGQPVNQKVLTNLPTKLQNESDQIEWPVYWRYATSPPYNSLSVVTNRILLSSYGAINSDDVHKNDIKCIVSVTHQTPVINIRRVEFIRIPIEDMDTENIGQYFDDLSNRLMAMEAVDNRKILIHSLFGKSRSATVVIAHLMKSQRMSLTSAFDFVKYCRPIIRLNNGFLRQLIQYEKRLFGKQFTNHTMIEQKNCNQIVANAWIAKYDGLPQLAANISTDRQLTTI